MKNWRVFGECRDVPGMTKEEIIELFFPATGVSQAKAKSICDTCVVKKQCLDYALANNIEHGIWGGTSERQRRRMRRARWTG